MATTLISLAEYLNTTYDPDVEYVDGQLVERNVGKWDHGRLIVLLIAWFFQHEEEWGIQTASDVRTRVSHTRVRLPDVLVVDQSAKPPVIEAPPVLCIEILSEGDTVAETKRKCEEYRGMGSQGIWIIDPMNRPDFIGLMGAGRRSLDWWCQIHRSTWRWLTCGSDSM